MLDALTDEICTTCEGAGKWLEFLPDDVDCMACGGTGRRDALAPEALFDEFGGDDADAFPVAFMDDGTGPGSESESALDAMLSEEGARA